MKTLFALCAVALGLGMSHAHAQQYVCSLTIQPAATAPQYGRHGYLSFNTSFAAACTNESQQLLCSAGATSNLCGAHARYNEAMLGEVFQALRSAQTARQQITAFSDTCIGGGNTSCVEGIGFSQNP